MKRIILLLLCFSISIVLAVAQSVDVKGKVVDEAGDPVLGATVSAKGSGIGTITDIDGNFSLTVPANVSTIIFSYLGMTTQEVPVKPVMNITMKEESQTLDEVVVTGYGVTRKVAFTGAATALQAADIVNKTDPNAIKSLEGLVPGLQMNVSSGQPGAPATMFVRGRNSLNSATQPLYIIDGVAMTSESMGMRSDEGASITPLANINSADIESITVLKDATATSIYGARAANGVIVVKTKSGMKGKVKVDFSAKLGAETLPSIPSSYKPLNQSQYDELQTEGIYNFWNKYQGNADAMASTLPGITGISPTPTMDASRTYLYEGFGLEPGDVVNTNWLDEVTRSGLIQDYNISIRGGGQSETAPMYFMSFNYFDNEAMVIGKNLTRYSFRLNLEQAPSKWVKLGINSALSYTETNLGTDGGYFTDPITQSYILSPLEPVYLEDGEWNLNTVSGDNPVAMQSKYGNKNNAKQYRALVSPYLTLSYKDKWYFTSRAGIDFSYLDEFGYWSFLYSQGREMRGFGEDGVNRRTLLSITNTLNYLETFKENHHLNLLFGQEAQTTNEYITYLAGSNYPVENLNSISLTSVPSSASSSTYNQALASFFFNGQYDYASKYYLSTSVRTDGSSRFGTNNKWAVFYSVGGRYRISGEDFMEGTKDWLSNLTIRSSYGTSGNQFVGDQTVTTRWYPSRGIYGYGFNYNKQPGSMNLQFANPDLKWERTAKFNVGMDLGLFNNRLNIETDFYIHNTKDMVFNVPISATTGITSDVSDEATYLANVGQLRNTGIEFTVSGRILNAKNLTWDAIFVGSHDKNEIVKLLTDNPIEATVTIIEKGHDIYTFKMREYAGVDPQTGHALWYKGTEGSETTTNYNEAGKRYLGKATPDFMGSLTNKLTIGNFDFSLQLNYSMGGKIYGSNLRYDEQLGNGWYNNATTYVYENRWQQPGDITDVPIYMFGETTSASSHSSRFLMDGDYLKLKNVTLGYSFPKSILKSLKIIETMRVYVSSDNLYTFTADNFRGFDAAGIGANGIQFWNYPTPRNYIFGLNVGF